MIGDNPIFFFPPPFNPGVDPYDDTQYTLPFYKFFDETDGFIYPSDAEFKTLFPANYNAIIQEAIKQEFYYKQVGSYIPQRFLRRFHRLLNERKDAWEKLLESESLIEPDDARGNYDMTETRQVDSQSTNHGTSTYTGNTSSNSETNTSDTSGATAWQSDTPDGSVDDIETYMSTANKNAANSTGHATANNTVETNDTSESNGNASGNMTETRVRKGNIGVTSFATIMEGYRRTVSWCVFDQVIFPEVDKLFFKLA